MDTADRGAGHTGGSQVAELLVQTMMMRQIRQDLLYRLCVWQGGHTRRLKTTDRQTDPHSGQKAPQKPIKYTE